MIPVAIADLIWLYLIVETKEEIDLAFILRQLLETVMALYLKSRLGGVCTRGPSMEELRPQGLVVDQ